MINSPGSCNTFLDYKALVLSTGKEMLVIQVIFIIGLLRFVSFCFVLY